MPDPISAAEKAARICEEEAERIRSAYRRSKCYGPYDCDDASFWLRKIGKEGAARIREELGGEEKEASVAVGSQAVAAPGEFLPPSQEQMIGYLESEVERLRGQPDPLATALEEWREKVGDHYSIEIWNDDRGWCLRVDSIAERIGLDLSALPAAIRELAEEVGRG